MISNTDKIMNINSSTAGGIQYYSKKGGEVEVKNADFVQVMSFVHFVFCFRFCFCFGSP